MSATSFGIVTPTLNAARYLEDTLRSVWLQASDRVHVDHVLVDGGSTDETLARARAAGARVLAEPRSGYGAACLAGVGATERPVVAFIDGDGSDDPAEIPRLAAPILAGEQDFVIGSRARGVREKGSMGMHQLVAGRVAGLLMRALYGVRYTDMCPLRAIRRDALHRLGMREKTYGWNLEMQMRAARAGLRILELPVRHRNRAGGASKVAGSLKGSVQASWQLASTLVRIAGEMR